MADNYPQGRSTGRPLDAIVGAVRLVHPFPVVVVVVTSLMLVLVASRTRPDPGMLVRVGAVVLLTQIPVGALNDFVDRHEDARVQPDKPIPSGQTSPRVALFMTAVPPVLLLPLALSFGLASLLLVTLGTAAGFAYDLWLKRSPFSPLGYLIAFLSLATWAWMLSRPITLPFFLVYPGGALLLVVAHLAQSFPDIETDRSLHHRGLAAVLGPQWTFRLILLLYLPVAFGAAALCIAGRSYMGLLPIAAGLCTLPLAWRLRQDAIVNRSSRQLVFRIMAPAVGLLAVGCLVSLRAIA